MVFSGTRASGALIATPAAQTVSTAATAASAARGMSCWLAPKVRAMNATSRPSRTTPLKQRVKAYQSSTRALFDAGGLLARP